MSAEKFEFTEEVCTFITPTLVKNTYLERNCTKEINRMISLYPHFNWDIVTELDLSFLDLTHIDNLSFITNVTRLKMNQNHIKSIANLDNLKKIEILDLGFNEITKIENLQHLTELRTLNLQGNKISKLENLNRNSKLQSLSVNNNEISDINEVFYMKRFEHLWFLELSNNPLVSNYEQIIIDQFPNLEFIDCTKIKRIDSSRNTLSNYVSSPKSSENSYFNLYRDSFLFQTDGKCFATFLYKEDPDGMLLSKWNSSVIAAFEEFQTEMTINAMDLCNTSLNRLAIRDEKIITFKTAYIKFTKKWIHHCRDKIQEFEEIKSIRLSELLGSELNEPLFEMSPQDSLIFDKNQREFGNYLSYININMNTAIQKLIKILEDVLDNEIKVFLDLLSPIFSNMREVELKYSKALSRNVKSVLGNPKQIIPDIFMQHFKNKYLLTLAVDKSADHHMNIIYNREAKMINDAKTWLKTTIQDLQNSERDRLWMVFDEVNKLLTEKT